MRQAKTEKRQRRTEVNGGDLLLKGSNEANNVNEANEAKQPMTHTTG